MSSFKLQKKKLFIIFYLIKVRLKMNIKLPSSFSFFYYCTFNEEYIANTINTQPKLFINKCKFF